jgi:hypothetical protein
LEERVMLTTPRQLVALFVDRSCGKWIVRDPGGAFWIVPAGENGWEHREPFEPADAVELEPVPGHYKCLLDLPF